MREAHHIELVTLRRTAYDRTVAGIRAHLDDAAFMEAWARGRAMPLDQAIEEALESMFQQTNEQKTASSVPPGITLSQPSPALSPRRVLLQHFGGLTTREREVAQLVAQGKSNRAIADELVVGVSTVEAHITHIFTKLGFSSRAQIAAWVVDKGLAQVPQDTEVKRQQH